MKILIIIPLLLTLSSCCNDNSNNYKCLDKQLDLVEKQVSICIESTYRSNRKRCFKEAKID